jgi:hypothetical protein
MALCPNIEYNSSPGEQVSNETLNLEESCAFDVNEIKVNIAIKNAKTDFLIVFMMRNYLL